MAAGGVVALTNASLEYGKQVAISATRMATLNCRQPIESVDEQWSLTPYKALFRFNMFAAVENVHLTGQ